MNPREMTRQEQDLLKMIAADVMEQIKRRRVTEPRSTLASEAGYNVCKATPVRFVTEHDVDAWAASPATMTA
jgi:hypothetical protein